VIITPGGISAAIDSTIGSPQRNGSALNSASTSANLTLKKACCFIFLLSPAIPGYVSTWIFIVADSRSFFVSVAKRL
jgi:hypothetical protein